MKVDIKEETIVKKNVTIECDFDEIKSFVDCWRSACAGYKQRPLPRKKDETYDFVQKLIDAGV